MMIQVRKKCILNSQKKLKKKFISAFLKAHFSFVYEMLKKNIKIHK